MKYIYFLILVLVGIGGYILPRYDLSFGASLPQTPALFETSLQSPITSTATSMTLTANSLRGGGSLSGYNCFTLDEGTAQWEVVCGTVASTAVTGMLRGINSLTGTSTDADLQFAHRRGANVKITDYPSISIMRNMMNGDELIPNAIKYVSAPTWTYGLGQLVTWDKAKDYTDSVSYGGTSNADTLTKGIVQIATGLQIASSTQLGSTGAYNVISADNATSTYGATSGLKAVITQNDGKIDSNFIRQSDNFAFSGNNTFSGTNLFTASSTHTATTTISASSVTNNALCLNGVCHSFPSSGLASSTAWTFDANGKVTYFSIPIYRSGVYSTTTSSSPISGSFGTTIIAHGLGRKPNKVTIFATGVDSANGSHSFTSSASMGTYNGTTQNAVCTSIGKTFTSGSIIHLEYNIGTQIGQYASISTDATNIYLTWSAINYAYISGTINLVWEAE